MRKVNTAAYREINLIELQHSKSLFLCPMLVGILFTKSKDTKARERAIPK